MIRVAFAMFLFLFISSCNEDEKCYSCDLEIDAWGKKNINEIASFNREKILQYSHSRQKAILGSLTPERKKILWQEKVDNLLTLDLTNGEKELLKWYVEAFKRFDYKNPISDKLEKEMYDNMVNGMGKFNWSNEFVYQAFFSLGDVKINLQKPLAPNITVAAGSACNCMYDMGCTGWNNNCGDPILSCNTNSKTDCGFFGGSDCGGICDSDFVGEQ